MRATAGAAGTTGAATIIVAAPSRRLPWAVRLRSPAVSVPVVAGLIAVVVTAAGSWIPSLWGDEAASALSAQRPLPSFLFEVTHVDAVHAVYYAALHLWVAVFGASAFALRFPSAIGEGATVAGVIVLVRLFATSWRLPVAAAALALALPRLDYAGIEARGYSWTATLAVWIAVVAVATLRGRLEPRLGWALFALLCGLGTALNLFVGSMMIVTGCLAAVWGPARSAQLRRWAGASAVALVLASPVLVFGAIEHGQVAFLAHRSVPVHAWLVSQWFGDPLFAALGWLLIAMACAVMLVRRSPELDRGLGLLAVLWAGLPSAFLIGTIPTLHNYTPRYLTFTAPAVAVLLALAIQAVFRDWKPAGAALLVLVLAAAVPSYLHERTPNAENSSDWAQVGAVIAANARPGDQLAFDEVVRAEPPAGERLAAVPRRLPGAVGAAAGRAVLRRAHVARQADDDLGRGGEAPLHGGHRVRRRSGLPGRGRRRPRRRAVARGRRLPRGAALAAALRSGLRARPRRGGPLVVARAQASVRLIRVGPGCMCSSVMGNGCLPSGAPDRWRSR